MSAIVPPPVTDSDSAVPMPHADLQPRRSRSARRLGPAIAVLFALLLHAGTAAAQGSFFGNDEPIPAVLARWETKFEPAKAHPGEHVRLLITARIEEGWYTYSVVKQDDEFAPPPTRITFESGGLTPEGPPYETNPIVKKDAVFGIPLAFHPRAVRFYQNFRVPEGQAAGTVEVTAAVRYQVCNNRICTPPRTDRLPTTLEVVEGPVREPFAYLQRTIDFIDKDGNFRIDAGTLEGALAGGLSSFLLLAAGFGLLALLTPCVFPMIPVTVSFFTGASERGTGAVLRLAVLFAAGIVLTSTTVGLALTFLLGATGVSQFATSPVVNLVVAGFFALFALGLMGLLDFAVPTTWTTGLSRLSNSVKGPLGVLLMGVAFTVTSFTCTMPFVGTLLVAATQGAVFWPVVGMLVFSSVFAFPFFLLALFPRLVVGLRGRSGNWLVQLKVVLGLLELGAALKFASNADVIWQVGWLDRSLLLGAWAGLAALAALVLLGLIPWPGVDVPSRRPLRVGVAGGFVLLALYTASGLTGRELDSYTESYLPPDVMAAAIGTGPAAAAGTGFVSAEAVHGLPWHRNLDDALAEAARTGKPVFIDFTGYTCVNCRWMEKKIFAARPVYDVLKERFVLAQLYTDGGEGAEENQRLQIERFRTLALPYYVVLAPDNAVLAKNAGIVPTPAEFLDFLAHGLRTTPKPTESPAQAPKAATSKTS